MRPARPSSPDPSCPRMGAVAERLGDRPAATTERDDWLAADVVLVAVDVSELKLAQVAGNKIRPVRFGHDFDGHAGPSREVLM